jgi:hypothetical protein
MYRDKENRNNTFGWNYDDDDEKYNHIKEYENMRRFLDDISQPNFPSNSSGDEGDEGVLSSKSENGGSSEGGYSGDSGGGGCFIATAVYGGDSWQVTLLRKFRDECLLTNIIGRMFVKLYYATSPPIANFLRRRTTLCKIVRMLLNPICKVVKKIIY